MLEFSLFGAGRIGSIHAANLASTPGVRLRYVVDVNPAAAESLAGRHGARALAEAGPALADPEVGAVVIASSTDTHVGLATAAARAGKAIFCEKPIDLDLRKVDECLAVVKGAGVPFFVAFNRRFDPSFAALHRALHESSIGKLESVIITSRDPSPPPLAYVKVSGGLFRDMMIHDFDMARWLLGEEPTELCALASCLVDPAIAGAGDVDTAMVTMRTESGVLCTISNSRRAVYGYDQRIEIFGERGMLQAGNQTPTTVVRSSHDGVTADKPLHFFLERYQAAYRQEMAHFVEAVTSGKPPSVGAEDGRAALMLAEAALKSLHTGQLVRLEPATAPSAAAPPAAGAKRAKQKTPVD